MLKQVENWDFNCNDCDEKNDSNLFPYRAMLFWNLDKININKLRIINIRFCVCVYVCVCVCARARVFCTLNNIRKKLYNKIHDM